MKEDSELMTIETLIKAQYMLAALKPDAESHYVIFIEDDPLSFTYNDKEVKIKTGQILHAFDERVPWDKITAKYQKLTNARLYTIMIFNYINRVCENIWKEHFPESDCILDTFSVDKATAFLSNHDKFSIGLELEEFCKSDTEVQEYFEIFEKHPEYSPLFKNPACLVLFYLIKKKQNETISNWTFSDNELKELLNIMNISNDIL